VTHNLLPLPLLSHEPMWSQDRPYFDQKAYRQQFSSTGNGAAAAAPTPCGPAGPGPAASSSGSSGGRGAGSKAALLEALLARDAPGSVAAAVQHYKQDVLYRAIAGAHAATTLHA
jgi:hypothetical protein